MKIDKPINEHLRPSATKMEQNVDLPGAIICDLDGTLALLNGRNPYDASTCENDQVNMPILEIINGLYKYQIIFTSGREEKYRAITEKWLKEKCNVPRSGYQLFMRETGDARKDAIIKEEIYEKHIKNKYHIKFVLDDRNRVVEMWRKIGLTCLQVAYGDF